MNQNILRVFVGWDRREERAYKVATASLRRHASVPLSITALDIRRLGHQGILRRPVIERDGRMFDVLSGAPQSTEFAISRFLVPLLAQDGWALFVDCDVVFTGDVAELLKLADSRYAVMCVKHAPLMQSGTKMDGQAQLSYPRKNWSSVVLWTCQHPAHSRLTLDVVNGARGLDLHNFHWLEDEHIGALPAGWNWLVNVESQPEATRIAHFTLGGPWLPGWVRQPHDELWQDAERQMLDDERAGGSA